MSGQSTDSLQAEIAASRAHGLELAHLLEAYEIVTQGEEATDREMSRLQHRIRTVEATSEQWATTCRELRREVWMLTRKVEVAQRRRDARTR